MFQFYPILVTLIAFPAFISGNCADKIGFEKQCRRAVKDPNLCNKALYKTNCVSSCSCCISINFPSLDFDYDRSKGFDRKTDSYMPYMPRLQGFVESANTYRFLTVQEQVLTIIGEAKHGLWRSQENGMVRLHRKKDKKGVKVGENLNNPDILSKINDDYAPYRKDLKSWYSYDPWNPAVPDASSAKFIDLPISHKYFKGRYNKHVPIDLPYFSCTMSDVDFPDAKELWDYVDEQTNANVIGPLGKRAGLDISQLYESVVRLHLFPDANIWVNIGSGNTARDVFNQRDIDNGNMDMDVVFRPLDTKKSNHEIYMFKRRSWNRPYLHIAVVIDNIKNNHMSYVRPDGVYWRTLPSETKESLKTTVTFDPVVPVINGGKSINRTMRYVPVAGVHHLNGHKSPQGSGGWCPQKGGMWYDYPWNPTGAGWINQYEEVTPICDAILVDVKVYGNLDKPSWSDNRFQLHNAGTRDKTQVYLGQGNQYGEFTDPYLVKNKIINPHALYFTKKSNPDPLPAQKLSINFETIGTTNRYIKKKCGIPLPKVGLTAEEKTKREKWIDEAE